MFPRYFEEAENDLFRLVGILGRLVGIVTSLVGTLCALVGKNDALVGIGYFFHQKTYLRKANRFSLD